MNPSFTQVSSSNIDGFLYLAERSLLLITFKSGATYAYEHLPLAVANGFGKASSKGRYFQSEIKDRFSTSKLDEEEVNGLLAVVGSPCTSARPPSRKPRISLESLIHTYPILTAVF